MAKTSDGRVAACAAAASLLHPEHPDGASTCWWGMLAVHPEHRGQALSLTLGAMAMLRMREVYGFTTFFTGVTPGNTASEVICRKLGLAHEGRSIVALADPALLPDGQMTK
jgi:RimJ/RimL family protein N-acetyltransferase